MMEPSFGTLALRERAGAGRKNGERPGDGRPVPVRARGIELLDRLAGSGYRDAPFLVRRADAQTFQVTPLLYNVLAAIDGRRDHTQIASAVSERIGKHATAERRPVPHRAQAALLGVLREPPPTTPPDEPETTPDTGESDAMMR